MARGRGAMEGSMWPKISFVLLIVALLFHLISFGAPHWAQTNSNAMRREHIGLWRYCTYPIGGGETCSDFIDIITGDWLKAAQSFGTLALFVLLGALGAVAVYAFVPDSAGDMRILGACFGTVGASFLFLMIECGVFGGKYNEYFDNKEAPGIWDDVGELSWAFALAVTSCVTVFISLALLVVELIMSADVEG
eukprot:GHVN01046111.1.p1 GENE.GHVN01046111.1~~GHVN01046111.1.p1  ORF type:complete len:211 (-),score=18.15 GHVN01046111.1:246-824(-)